MNCSLGACQRIPDSKIFVPCESLCLDDDRSLKWINPSCSRAVHNGDSIEIFNLKLLVDLQPPTCTTSRKEKREERTNAPPKQAEDGSRLLHSECLKAITCSSCSSQLSILRLFRWLWATPMHCQSITRRLRSNCMAT
eukprot:CAMPEP_0169268396 /NCGR_PEP_ID=MMETSP1016-20121227/47770_1 /TAXON_ID=342587 /ORGANISM="Karlodinium micrum, Strain CCMP2283" /LENGTH=137 /DNA_ID=CAMNT_0009353089 /DNA_START=843 /DNA_END=1252 /DNA_ORIENTATION=+